MFQQVTRSQRWLAITGIVVLDHGKRTPLCGMKAGLGQAIDQGLRVRSQHRDQPVPVLGSLGSGNECVAEPAYQPQRRSSPPLRGFIAIGETVLERPYERRGRLSAEPVQDVGAPETAGEPLQNRVVARSQHVEGPHDKPESPRRRQRVEQPELQQPTELIGPALHRHRRDPSVPPVATPRLMGQVGHKRELHATRPT